MRRGSSLWCALSGFSLILTAQCLFSCGYRPVGGTLPGGAQSVRVVQPNPARIDAPELSRMLGAELIRQLARSGIRASSTGAAQSVLHTNILALKTVHSVLDPVHKVVVARQLQLQLELRLADDQGKTLWRSGLLQVERAWPMSPSASALTHDGARRHALQSLSVDAARQITEVLTSGL